MTRRFGRPPGLGLISTTGIGLETKHLCMRLTAAFGLPTARTEMREVAGRRTLVVERFERRHTRCRPSET